VDVGGTERGERGRDLRGEIELGDESAGRRDVELEMTPERVAGR
jgi:hypothetical protein